MEAFGNTWMTEATKAQRGGSKHLTIIYGVQVLQNWVMVMEMKTRLSVMVPAVVISISLPISGTHLTYRIPRCTGTFLVKLKRDDGAVIYVNGQEVMRSNFGTNTYGYLDKSYTAVSTSNEPNIYQTLIDTSFFQY